jgi:hypothetical protein
MFRCVLAKDAQTRVGQHVKRNVALQYVDHARTQNFLLGGARRGAEVMCNLWCLIFKRVMHHVLHVTVT